MQIVVLDDRWEDQYREFCHGLGGLTIYGTWEFRQFLLNLLGCRNHYLGVVDAGRIVAALPLMERDGRFGRVVNSLPFFGSYGDILGDLPSARRLLIDAYCTIASEPDVATATWIENPFNAIGPDINGDFEDIRIGQFTPLDLGENPSQALMSRIDPTARRNLRNAERNAIEVVVDNEAFAELEAIHRENMLAIGGRTKPSAFFDLVPLHFAAGKMYNLYVARRRGVIIAALLLFYAGLVAEYYMPATRLAERRLQPSAALLARAMLDAYRRGYRVWNWGGTWLTQQSVLRFKRKWGAVDRPYRYFVQVNRKDILSTTAEQLSNEYEYFYVLPFNKLTALTG